MDIKQYIWDREIQEVSTNTVTFIDWAVEDYTDKQLEYIISDEPLDYSVFDEVVIKAISDDVLEMIWACDIYDPVSVAKSVLEVYEDHDIRMWQVDKVGIRVMTLVKEVMETVAESYMIGYKMAIGKAFWTDKEWLHHDFYVEDIKVSDIIRVRKK